MIQQNITIFLGVDYTILGLQRMLKQQPTLQSLYCWSELQFKPYDLFQYVITPCILPKSDHIKSPLVNIYWDQFLMPLVRFILETDDPSGRTWPRER